MPLPGARNEHQLDHLARDAYLSLHVADSRFTQDVERICRGHGVSRAQYQVLWVLCLADAPDGIALGAIADGLLTTSADTSRLVEKLVAGGLATRTVDADDRRVTRVAPTPAGRALFERLVPDLNALHREQWAALDEDELATLVVLINKALWPVIEDPA